VKANFSQLVSTLPFAANDTWPAGVPFVNAMAHGSMSVEAFAPNEIDRQSPHEQDELYFIQRGSGVLTIEGVAHACAAGDVLFVGAGQVHRFTELTKDFATWVVFWGPKGGEQNKP
jgi:mannose-6-phosphate isomerase-like protein (cupin superfamily)